jgi:hypothetical protein
MVFFLVVIFVLIGVFAVYLVINNDQVKDVETDQSTDNVGLANPASVNCTQNGGTLEIRETADGQIGYCKFADGSECEEWAYFRKECSSDNGNLKISSEINVDEPKPYAIVSSPLKISGQALGNWFFEANAGVELQDANGKVIATGYSTAKGDWMTEDKVSFESILIFPKPETETGVLILKNNNPSDLPENSKSFEVPVKFSDFGAEKMTVLVYFPNKEKDPEMLDCSEVYSVERKIVKTATVAKAAVEELLAGPTNEEVIDGYFTSIKSGVKLQNLTIENEVAKVDFSSNLDENIGGSCLVASITAQIQATLEQFPTVKSVIISIDGRTEDILQP